MTSTLKYIIKDDVNQNNRDLGNITGMMSTITRKVQVVCIHLKFIFLPNYGMSNERFSYCFQAMGFVVYLLFITKKNFDQVEITL